MPSHWLSEDGQRAIEIIGPIEWEDQDETVRLKVSRGRFYSYTPTTLGEIFTRCEPPLVASCILDHHAEKWLHGRGFTVRYDTAKIALDWNIFLRGEEYAYNFKDKSQALIAAILAAEEAT